ncbi:sodium-dependent transporter [Simiduia aestuariiviva]|uniref:NSS family neurotransmitter:Na+ symporter n=1 Tax=Simiduia aestuariiviva TaxID=1510459 RepID=A0A839ULW8_9GAMM|nr:sodium-dependent transporter [Simiduia aestuariiviva]MBB3167539.1 NSS family neurotransmitter:Na+ symporter [Simiduia aestuariiviva]
MTAPREQFGSRLGFILAAAGSAVGIGNLVGFPVNAAKNGGGAFLLMYAIFVFVICLPVMMAELATGRHSAKGPLGAYASLTHGNRMWGIAGWLSTVTPFMIAVFYTVITVWLFEYLFSAVTGDLDVLADPATFGAFINNGNIFIHLAIVVAIVNLILVGGVKEGIERSAKILMPALFMMLIGMVIFVLTRDNAMTGLKFYLIPDFSKITGPVVSGALGQAFFSLSLGMGILITYGSYMDKRSSITSSAKMVALADTGVAFCAGLMILPAIFSFNPETDPTQLSDSSVSLIFTFLPKIFLALQTSIGYMGASVVASVFFLLVFFAALTSLVSIIEVPAASLVDQKGYSRKKALLILNIGMVVFTIACTASFGMVGWLTEFVHYAGSPKSLFDVVYDIFYDTILPLNGLLICLFVIYRWKKSNLNEELETGDDGFKGSFLERYMNFSLGTFIPLILALIFINTVAIKFFGRSLLASIGF